MELGFLTWDQANQVDLSLIIDPRKPWGEALGLCLTVVKQKINHLSLGTEAHPPEIPSGLPVLI